MSILYQFNELISGILIYEKYNEKGE